MCLFLTGYLSKRKCPKTLRYKTLILFSGWKCSKQAVRGFSAKPVRSEPLIISVISLEGPDGDGAMVLFKTSLLKICKGLRQLPVIEVRSTLA